MFKKVFYFFSLFLISIFFVKPVFSQNSAGNVAKINESLVPTQYFQTIYEGFMNDYRATNPGAVVDKETIQWAKRYVMDEIIKRELLMQEARKSKIQISEEEIEEQIKLDPFFKDKNGKFDKTKYLWAKNDPKIDWAKIKGSLYEEVLFLKFEKIVTNKEKVTEKEVLDEYKKSNEKIKIKFFLLKNPEIQENQINTKELRDYFEKNKASFMFPETAKVKYVLLTPDKFEKEVYVSEEEIKAYYQTHLNEYKYPERVKVRYIVIDLPQDGNTFVLQEKMVFARNVLKQLNEGMDFVEAAKKYSEEKASAEKGGDAGFIKRGQTPKEIENIIFSLKEGQISDLKQLTSKIYIFKVETKKQAGLADLGEAREAITMNLKIEKAMSKAFERAQEFAGINNISELEKRSSLYGGLIETKFFAKDEAVETIGLIPELNKAAFKLNSGQINTEVITIMLYPGYNGYIVMAVSDKMQAHPAKYEEVETKTKELFIQEKQSQALKNRVEQLKLKLNPENFEIQAKAFGETVSEISLTRTQGYLDKIGYSPLFVADVFDSFTLNVKTFYFPFGVCFYRVVEKVSIDEAAFKREKEQIQKRLLSQKNSESFAKWYETLKSRSEIKVYLEGY